MKENRRPLLKKILGSFLAVAGISQVAKAEPIEEKEVSGPKNSKQRDSDAIAVIAKYVNKSPEKVLEEIMEARKGASIFKSKLKMKKFKEQSQV